MSKRKLLMELFEAEISRINIRIDTLEDMVNGWNAEPWWAFWRRPHVGKVILISHQCLLLRQERQRLIWDQKLLMAGLLDTAQQEEGGE